MPKLSDNQQASLDALINATAERQYVSKAVWKKACPDGVSVNTGAMLKVGAVQVLIVGVSTNGKPTEVFRPAASVEG